MHTSTCRPFGLILGFLFLFFIASLSPSKASTDFPVASSKKGLQVESVPDALELGVKHATFNFNLAQCIDPAGNTNNPAYTANGKTYRFKRSYVEHMDRQIKSLSDQGILVYLILLVYESGNPEVNRILLHPKYSTNAPNRLSAFNLTTEEGRAWYEATMSFIAHRWSRWTDKSHGKIVGYIMGNEVNSHWWWSHMGPVTMQEFTEEYLQAVRLAHHSIRKYSPGARIYLSLEHHWNSRYPAGNDRQAFPGKLFLEHFAQRARESGDFDWHLAFHPYPENLFEPRFWNDQSALPSPETPRITFKNLEVLTRFMRKPEMQFQGRTRSVILSEQGFHTPPGAEGEIVQAAAYCYAYKKVEKLAGVDAFILHRHVDHDGEGGLLLGLRRNKPAEGEALPKKRIYDCFRLADTPHWEKAFSFALPVIGLKSWSDLD